MKMVKKGGKVPLWFSAQNLVSVVSNIYKLFIIVGVYMCVDVCIVVERYESPLFLVLPH